MFKNYLICFEAVQIYLNNWSNFWAFIFLVLMNHIQNFWSRSKNFELVQKLFEPDKNSLKWLKYFLNRQMDRASASWFFVDMVSRVTVEAEAEEHCGRNDFDLYHIYIKAVLKNQNILSEMYKVTHSCYKIETSTHWARFLFF